jgi:hypothetical protein
MEARAIGPRSTGARDKKECFRRRRRLDLELGGRADEPRRDVALARARDFSDNGWIAFAAAEASRRRQVQSLPRVQPCSKDIRLLRQ